jgi:predicted transcriptional regulator
MLCNASVNGLKIVGVRLAGLSITKTPTLLGVSRAAVSKVMKVYANNGKTTSAKRNCGQKPKIK